MSTSQQRGNWQSAEKQPGDYLLNRQYIQSIPFHNKSITKTVRYPRTGTRRETIHFISATDQNGKGASLNILSGGVNCQFVQLDFTSQRGSGLNYLLEVWGQH